MENIYETKTTIDATTLTSIVSSTASKSDKIRMLFEEGLEKKSIADALGISYNFVYNVLQNHCIKNGIEMVRKVRSSNKDAVLELLREGKSLAEVSRLTKMNYNQVWKMAHDNGLTKKQTTVVEEKEPEPEEVVVAVKKVGKKAAAHG